MRHDARSGEAAHRIVFTLWQSSRPCRPVDVQFLSAIRLFHLHSGPHPPVIYGVNHCQ